MIFLKVISEICPVMGTIVGIYELWLVKDGDLQLKSAGYQPIEGCGLLIEIRILVLWSSYCKLCVNYMWKLIDYKLYSIV